MAHAFSMNYEREIRENEIRLRNEQIAERRGWPGIGTLPKKYPLPETVEGDLEIYWNSLSRPTTVKLADASRHSWMRD